MRTLLVAGFCLFMAAACSSSGGGTEDSTGGNSNQGGADGGSSSSTGGSGSAGASNLAETAQLRFVYQADWATHLASCAAISDYRIKFGASPVPVTATIDLTGAVGTYVSVDGRSYADADVLHIFTCSKSQTSKQTLQLFGKFGVDLPLMPAHKYTVTLAGSVATLTEDP